MQSGPRSLRAVVDTNLFISAAITRRGVPFELLARWRQGSFTLLMSAEQRAELDDVLRRPELIERYRITPQEVGSLLLLVDVLAVRVVPRRRLPVRVRDPKDDHLVGAAIAGGADYLVSGDGDVLELDAHPGIARLRIVTARVFLDILAAQTP